MIGVDTNVLLRLLVDDDAEQREAARSFFSARSPADPAFVGSLVLAETIWLLRRRLSYSNEAVREVIAGLLSSDEFVVEHGERLRATLDTGELSATDVADRLIAWSAEAAGCAQTVTFDRRAARSIPSMELLS